MRPVKTSETNCVFKPPPGLGPDECGDLPARVTAGCPQHVAAVWELTAEERRLIAAGGNLRLTIWGSVPPHLIEVTMLQREDRT